MNSLIAACHSKACAPPPIGTGGSGDGRALSQASLAKAALTRGSHAKSNTSAYPVDTFKKRNPSDKNPEAPGAGDRSAVRGHRGMAGTDPERRIPRKGETVDIYRDLGRGREHKRGFPDGDAFSVRHASALPGENTGLVVASTTGVILNNGRPSWAHSAKAQAEVAGKRGVHGFIRGEVAEYKNPDVLSQMVKSDPSWKKVTYYPGTQDFFDPGTRKRFVGSDQVALVKGEFFAKNPKYVDSTTPVSPIERAIEQAKRGALTASGESFACYDASCAPPPVGTGGSSNKGSGIPRPPMAKGEAPTMLTSWWGGWVNPTLLTASPAVEEILVTATRRGNLSGFRDVHESALKGQSLSTGIRPLDKSECREASIVTAQASQEKLISDGFPSVFKVVGPNKVDGDVVNVTTPTSTHYTSGSVYAVKRSSVLSYSKALIPDADTDVQLHVAASDLVRLDEDFSLVEFACHDASCAPPPVGTGGSKSGGKSGGNWAATKRAYNSGYSAGLRASYDSLERADKRGVPKAWYAGFMDAEGGHPKGHSIGMFAGKHEIIKASEARGDSKPVSAEEFQKLASQGQAKLDKMRANTHTNALASESVLKPLKEQAWEEVQTEWGGMTIDAKTGVPLPQGVNKYAMTVKEPGMNTISVPIGSSKEVVQDAMDRAVAGFDKVLKYEGHHLGVFRDDDVGRIDFDPVIVVDNLSDVHTIGAATRAIGGAYNFSDGNGYWPPHVKDS